MAEVAAASTMDRNDVYHSILIGSLGLMLLTVSEPSSGSRLDVAPMARPLFQTGANGGIRAEKDVADVAERSVPELMRLLSDSAETGLPEETAMLLELLSANTTPTTQAVLEHMERRWHDLDPFPFQWHPILVQFRERKIVPACSLLSKMMEEAWPELADRVNAIERLQPGETYEQYVLPSAVLAADGIVSSCTGKLRESAIRFLVETSTVILPGTESSSRIYLASALAPLVDDVEAAEKYVVAEIEIGNYPNSEMFRRIPRDSRSKELAVAIYDALNSIPSDAYSSIVVDTEWAMLEALSAFEVTEKVVPSDFWQMHWDRRKFDLVRPAWTMEHPAPDRISEEMLTEDKRAFLRSLDVKIAP